MPLPTNWVVDGRRISYRSVSGSPLLLLTPTSPCVRLPRPSRRPVLGVACQLRQGQQGLQSNSRGISKGASPQPALTPAALGGPREMTGSGRGPEAQQAVAAPAVAAGGRSGSTALQQQQQQAAASPSTSQQQPLSPSAIHLTVASGAVVAPELEYTVVLDMLHKNAAVNPEASIRGGVVLGLTSPVGPTTTLDITVGQLNFKRLLACARNKLWWMTPEWRSATWSLPPETQFLLAEMREGGPYALLLPLIDGDFRATLRGPAKRSEGANGELVLRLESGSPEVKGSRWPSALYVAASWDPYELIDRGVAAAAALSGGARPRSTKQMPASLDGFGWCTWDAFYSTVSARGLAEGLSALEAGGVSPQLLIIDDGWQMTDVDPPMRKTPAADLADKLHVEGEPRRLLEATQDEFFYESQEVVADAAAHMPPSTSLASVMPTLANLGPQHNAHLHSHSGSITSLDTLDVNTVNSMDNANVGGNNNDNGNNGGGSSGAAASKAQRAGSGAAAIDSSGVGVSIADAMRARPAADGRGAAADGTATTSTAVATRPVIALAPAAATPPADAVADDGGAASASMAIWFVRVGQKIAGWVMGIATAGFLIFYQWVVEPAPPNSVAVRAFASAAKGFLRPAMLGFYATASDFTRRLTSVRANGKFSGPEAGPDTDWSGVPEALGTVVAHIKRKFGVRYVYCWHGLPGYWAGVMPTDDAALAGGGGGVPGLESHICYASPTAGVLEIEPSMAWNPAVLAGIGVVTDPTRLYNAMHRYLHDSGVDGVKVDCQAGVGLIGSAMGGGAALSAMYQAALEGSVAAHFAGNHVINCMCHSTENLYRMTATAVARASDDFYPRDPASSHPHVAACAFNSLFLGALLQPDWDMFHSKHPAAHLHAVARAVSGGPVYVSDKPGEHDFALLHALVLPDGSVLRAGLPGRPTRDCLFADVLRDERSLLKVWNMNPVTGVVGVFHLQGSSWDRVRRKFYTHDKDPRRLSTEVRPYDVDAFRPASTGSAAAEAAVAATSEFAVFSRNSGLVSLLRGNEAVQVSLPSAEADILTVSPVVRVGPVAFAPLGLSNMINGGGAVRVMSHAAGRPAPPASVTGGSGGKGHGGGAAAVNARELVFTMTIRGHGDLLAYCSREPDLVLLNGARLTPEVCYSFARGAVATAGAVAEGGRLRVDLPRVSDLENEVQVVFRSFE